MVLRKQKEVENFIKIIDREWSLSIDEENTLESILYLFLAGKNDEIRKIEHLINEETENLLKLLNDREVIEYATEEFDLVRNKTYDLEEALDTLNFKWIEKVSDTDMIKTLQDDGWSVGFDKDYPKYQEDIVTQSDLEEMTKLFLSADFNKRQEIINNLK